MEAQTDFQKFKARILANLDNPGLSLDFERGYAQKNLFMDTIEPIGTYWKDCYTFLNELAKSKEANESDGEYVYSIEIERHGLFVQYSCTLEHPLHTWSEFINAVHLHLSTTKP